MAAQETEAVDEAGELTGLYEANVTGTSGASMYPDDVEQVFVCPERDGYHDVYLIDADGNLTAAGNRAAYRIDAALEGEEGYDIVVNSSA